MGKSVLAKVHWVLPEEGGRTSLPTGKTYATMSRNHSDAAISADSRRRDRDAVCSATLSPDADTLADERIRLLLLRV
jgi:hypothetical protein